MHVTNSVVHLKLILWRHAPQNIMFLWRTDDGVPQKDDIMWRMGWCATEFQF
jgi:hypothetical protein